MRRKENANTQIIMDISSMNFNVEHDQVYKREPPIACAFVLVCYLASHVPIFFAFAKLAQAVIANSWFF